MKKVCFASGNFYLPEKKEINKEIEQSLKYDVDGIELTFQKPSDLIKFKLTSRAKAKLRKLHFNTIHAPYLNQNGKTLYYWNSKFCKKLLQRMHRIYDEVNAVNINFHPYQIKNFRLLEDKEHNYTIENVTSEWNFNLKYYKNILDANPNIDLLLDTSHALPANQLNALVKNFRKRIKYVHLSNVYDGYDHMFLFESTKEELKNIEIVKKLDVPFIIEAWYGEKEYFKFFNKEIGFVRKWLK